MGVMSEFDRQLQEISRVMADDCEPGTPEQLVEERVHRMAEEMTDLAMLALDPDQKPLLQREARGIAQILLRAKLILSVFEGEDIEQIRRLIVALEVPKRPLGQLSVVRNNG
jgi:hypothetical protein